MCVVDVDRTSDAVLKAAVLSYGVCDAKLKHSEFDQQQCKAQSGRALAGYFKGLTTSAGQMDIRQIVPYEDVYNAFAAGLYSVGTHSECARKRPDGTCDYSPLPEGTIKYTIASASGFATNPEVCSKTDVKLSDTWTGTLFDETPTEVSGCMDVPEYTKHIQMQTVKGVATVELAQTYSQEPFSFKNSWQDGAQGDEWSAPGGLKTTLCKVDATTALVSQCTIGFEGGSRWFGLDPGLSIAPLPSSPLPSPPPSPPRPSPPPPSPSPPPPSMPPPSESSVWIWVVVGVSILVVGVIAFLACRYMSVEVETP